MAFEFTPKTVVRVGMTAFALGAMLVASNPAAARDGVGAGIAAGILGGAAVGAIVAGAAQAPPPVVYPAEPVYAPGPYAPGPVYAAPPPYGEPACWWQRERFWNGYGWAFRRVRVCN